MQLSDPILSVKGIGEKTAGLYEQLGIHSVDDLLHYFPRTYEKYEEPVVPCEELLGRVISIEGIVIKEPRPIHVRNLSILKVSVRCQNVMCRLTYFNMPYLRKVFQLNSRHIFRGKLALDGSAFVLEQPKMYKPEEYGEIVNRLLPVYPLTKGLTNHSLMKAIRTAEPCLAQVEDLLPEFCRTKHSLMELPEALHRIHFPVIEDEIITARNRVVFDEFFYFLLKLELIKKDCIKLPNDFPMIEVAETKRILDALPYHLTGAQERVWKEIAADLESGYSMNRLVQGDVGSGKTIIAFLALIMTASNGYQSAMMAPTEVLARQHFEALQTIMKQHGFSFKPVLLSGSLSAKQKREAYEMIVNGEYQIIIGTHAIFQEKVQYQKLALVITDEQHRFGVRQRETLANKGIHTHVLVMSATPIPRSLALILYGDMNLSVIDEIPANRKAIKNCVVGEDYRPKAHQFILKEVQAGRQAYIICPMIEENEDSSLSNVLDYYEKLKAELPETVRVGFLHGKMKNEEKNKVMELFSEHLLDVLVSTTVIEVGINVPNATVMMIENAERFGLASLHQLRGRVGRGEHQSYCIFLNGSKNENTQKRLEILMKSNDGFEIANEDLKLRGPGDLTGVAQSGEIPFELGDIYADQKIMYEARECVEQVLEQDPLLELPQNGSLRNYLALNQNISFDFRTI